MNCVGIDVSKGKSMIAVMRPFGEVVVSPFEVRHTANELSELAGLLKSLDGETRVVMESTGNYHAPVAWLLHDAGLYVSVVNAMLVHDYGNNSLRRAKTDKKDAVKLANYGLDHWLTLPRYIPEEDTRLMLKICYRQYQQYSKVQTMLKNNLISLLDTTFPDANRLFTSPPRADGSEKWVDFVATFWHCECVCGRSEKAFTTQYQKWCRKHGYNFSEDKALDIYASACRHFGVIPKTDTAKLLVEQAISQLQTTSSALAALKQEMQSLAASLPEYPVVMGMFGVGPTLGPQLLAEIGDVRRFHSKKALVAFAGIDAPPYQSGQIDVRSRSISKRGSASLRRTLFLVMGVSELPYKLLFAVIYTHLEFRYEVSHTITSHHVHHFHQTRIPDGTLLDYMVQYRKPLFPQFFLYPKKFLPENNPHHKEFHLRPYIQNNANQ